MIVGTGRPMELHTMEGFGGKKEQKSAASSLSLTHATPLLPAPTLSEGESRVSAGESMRSRRVELRRSSRAPLSKPKLDSSIFGGPRQTSSASPWWSDRFPS
jgi:hypothetical protein